MVQFNPVLMKPLQLTKEQVDKGAKGPGNAAISLWDEIRSDVNFDFGENGITNISTDIFPDQNEQSGYYYYFPASYNLKWDRDESYQLRILYGSAADNQGTQVNMFVQLTPAVGTKEKSMVETLVKEYASKNKLPFEKLANHSIVQTLQRSINTQLMTVEFMLLSLALFGGVTLREFAVILLVGLLSGTYSSIFIAAPILVVWENKEWRTWFHKEKVSA